MANERSTRLSIVEHSLADVQARLDDLGDSPGIRESVVDGETGFLVPGSDVAAYAAAMRGLVESPDLVRALGSNARRFAETFTWERAAQETLHHLHRVVEEGSDGDPFPRAPDRDH